MVGGETFNPSFFGYACGVVEEKIVDDDALWSKEVRVQEWLVKLVMLSPKYFILLPCSEYLSNFWIDFVGSYTC